MSIKNKLNHILVHIRSIFDPETQKIEFIPKSLMYEAWEEDEKIA